MAFVKQLCAGIVSSTLFYDIAFAQSPSRGGKIPLAEALRTLSATSDLEFLFSDDIIAGVFVTPINQYNSLDDALVKMLRGTRLKSKKITNNLFAIIENPTKAKVEEIPKTSFGDRSLEIPTFPSPPEKFSLDDEVVVTGSHVPQKEIMAHFGPAIVITRDELLRSGEDTARAIFNLTENQGSETQPNIFLQNFSAGTAQFNLRGLGLGTTLVLVDHKRISKSAASAQDGSSFVDLNSIPKIAIKQVDILKDGAAAIYGSDAVAGVVNYNLIDEFDGAEIYGGFQSTLDNRQQTYELATIFGRHFENGLDLVGAINFVDQSPLDATDRDFTTGTGFSLAGQPANYILLPTNGQPPPLNLDPPLIADPQCVEAGGQQRQGSDDCLFDFIQYAQLILPETKFQLYGSAKKDWNNTTRLYSNIIWAENKVNGQTLPASLPSLGGVIPANHPQNPFAFDAVFIGRPFGNNLPAAQIFRNNETFRLVTGIRHLARSNWVIDGSVQYSSNKYRYNFPDVRLDRLQAGFLGQSGPNNDQYFNPFGFTQGNNQAVIDDIRADTFRAAKTELVSFNGTLTGHLGGTFFGDQPRVATGIELRREGIDVNFDHQTNLFELAYIGGAKNFSDSETVTSAFVEFALPLWGYGQAQAALRYENYDNFGNSFDPKLAVHLNVSPDFQLRGSYSTTFRAPSLLQSRGYQGAVAEILPGQFATVVYTPNPNLKNESAQIGNLGFSYDVISKSNAGPKLNISADFWNIDYNDLVIGSDPRQTVLQFNQDLNAGLTVHNNLNTSVALNEFVDRGGEGVFSRNNTIAGVIAPFKNAASVKSNGLDVAVKIEMPTSLGNFSINANATKTFKYDLKAAPSDTILNGLGKRNQFNFGRSNSELRVNSRLRWEKDQNSLKFASRYINAYQDETSGDPIGSHAEFDVHYSRRFGEAAQLSIGVLNFLDTAPPNVDTFFGFDTQMHNPRGATGFVNITLAHGK